MLIEILSAATGAVVGGALTGLASYVRLGKVVAIVETEVRGRIVGISCHFGRNASHSDDPMIADRSRLCKLRTSVLADLSKSAPFYAGFQA